MTPTRPPAAYLIGDDGVTTWSERHADASIGLLETHKRLTRTLDAELEGRYRPTRSSLELLARLAATPDQRAFFDDLGADELETLASVFRRIPPRPAETCTE